MPRSLFEQVMREHMDFSDALTVHAIAEAAEKDVNQTRMMTALTGKLYDKISEKADKVDFSSISRSRGDITKIEKYDQLMECIDIIRGIAVGYKQDTKVIDIVSAAVNNTLERRDMFKRAFVIGSPIIIMTYNTLGLSFVESVSLLIATTIQYIVDPRTESFTMALDVVSYNKMMNDVLFKNLMEFNESCKSGEFDNAMRVAANQNKIKHEAAELDSIEIKPDSPFLSDEDMANGNEVVIHDEDLEDAKHKFNESFIADGAMTIARGVAFISKYAIAWIRDLVYRHYLRKAKISDYFAMQADMIEMNAYNLKYKTSISEDDKKKIFAKQMKFATTFRNISNRFSLDYKSARTQTNKFKEEEDAEKYRSDGGEEEETYQSSLF